jgi:hypothetical protein
MGIQRIFGLAGLFLAGATLTGCQSNRAGYCDNGSGSPYGRGTAVTQNQNTGWNQRPMAPATQGVGGQGAYADSLRGTGTVAGTATPGKPTDLNGTWDTTGGRMGTPASTVTPASFSGSGDNLVNPPSAPVKSTTNSSPGSVPPLSFGGTSSTGGQAALGQGDGMHAAPSYPASVSAASRAGIYSDEAPGMGNGQPSSTVGTGAAMGTMRPAAGDSTVQPPAPSPAGNMVHMSDTLAPAPAPRSDFGTGGN